MGPFFYNKAGKLQQLLLWSAEAFLQAESRHFSAAHPQVFLLNLSYAGPRELATRIFFFAKKFGNLPFTAKKPHGTSSTWLFRYSSSEVPVSSDNATSRSKVSPTPLDVWRYTFIIIVSPGFLVSRIWATSSDCLTSLPSIWVIISPPAALSPQHQSLPR